MRLHFAGADVGELGGGVVGVEEGFDPQELYTGRHLVMPDGITTIKDANDFYFRKRNVNVTYGSGAQGLYGSDTIGGGSIIMPIDMRIEATTMSMTRKGSSTSMPIWKPVLSSLSM